jgi:anti-sigma factor RsiW
MTLPPPITEADLHALVDGQLADGRAREVEAYLVEHPDDARRVAAWRRQKQALRQRFASVADEAVPTRLMPSRLVPSRRRRRTRWAWGLAASLMSALVGGVAGWALHGRAAGDRLAAEGFAQRAAIAHAVYVPDARRPVEIGADHEDQLVTWLSKRMGAPMKAPHLQALGYGLEGGRLLPGGSGPVAQFMYRDGSGARLTLYVSNEGPPSSGAPATAFRFAKEGAVNTFFWIDGPFGYALSSSADRAELARVAAEVYRQLGRFASTGSLR